LHYAKLAESSLPELDIEMVENWLYVWLNRGDDHTNTRGY